MKHFKAFRLKKGADLYKSLITIANEAGPASHAVVTCVGSLTHLRMRLAGATPTNQNIKDFEGPFEIVSLVGTIAGPKAHLHISVSNSDGKTIGGHLLEGSLIDTTAEVVLANLNADKIHLTRENDPETGFTELAVNEE